MKLDTQTHTCVPFMYESVSFSRSMSASPKRPFWDEKVRHDEYSHTQTHTKHLISHKSAETRHKSDVQGTAPFSQDRLLSHNHPDDITAAEAHSVLTRLSLLVNGL